MREKLSRIWHDEKADLFISCFVYILSLSIIVLASIHHEPWYDEFQSWNIAKYASVSEILSKLCRLEGHPPLYYLYLKPFTLLPSFIGLRLSSFVLSAFTNYMILFKMEWGRVKYILPFTFFLFYQYAVVNRVYVLMTAIAMMLIYCWEKKDEMKVGYTLLLCLFSGTGVHSMIVSGILFLTWMIESGNIHLDKETARGIWEQIKKERKIILIFTFVHLAYVVVLMPVFDIGETIAEYGDMNPFIAFCVMFLYVIGSAFGYPHYSITNTRLFENLMIDNQIQMYLVENIFFILVLFYLFRKQRYFRLFLISSVSIVFIGTMSRIWYHHTGYLFIMLLFMLYANRNAEASLFNRLILLVVLMNSCYVSYRFIVSDIYYPYGQSAYPVYRFIEDTWIKDEKILALEFNPVNVNSFFEEEIIDSNQKHEYVENVLDKYIYYEDIQEKIGEYDIYIRHIWDDDGEKHELETEHGFIPCMIEEDQYVAYINPHIYNKEERLRNACEDEEVRGAWMKGYGVRGAD